MSDREEWRDAVDALSEVERPEGCAHAIGRMGCCVYCGEDLL